MGFIHNKVIPDSGEYLIVFIELSAYQFRTTHILHGGEVHIFVTFLGKSLQTIETLALSARTVVIIAAVVEYLTEILKPSFIDYRAMGKDDGTLHFQISCHTERTQCFAETHFGVPQHLIALFELLFGLFYSSLLLWTKHNRILCGADITGVKARLSMLDSRNRFLYGFKVTTIPLVSSFNRIKDLLFYARTFQNAMHLFVIKRANSSSREEHCHFRIKKIISDASSLCVLVNTFPGSLVQYIAVGCREISIIFI